LCSKKSRDNEPSLWPGCSVDNGVRKNIFKRNTYLMQSVHFHHAVIWPFHLWVVFCLFGGFRSFFDGFILFRSWMALIFILFLLNIFFRTPLSTEQLYSLGSIIWNFCKKDIFPLKNPNSNQVQLCWPSWFDDRHEYERTFENPLLVLR
jgi:hypothetical protein